MFFALFNSPENNYVPSKEAVAAIKIASSRMATQSERLGYEFARRLGVRTPQARVILISSPEWQRIKDAADRARDMAISMHGDVGEMTCSELVESLELGQCLFLMNYIHGSPLLESQYAFGSQDVAKRTAAALGRVLAFDSDPIRYCPRVIKALQKERRSFFFLIAEYTDRALMLYLKICMS